MGADGLPIGSLRQGKQHRLHQSSDQQYDGRGAICDCHVRLAVLIEDQADDNFWRGKPRDSAVCYGSEAIRIPLAMVRVRSSRKRDHPRLLLEKQRTPAFSLRAFFVNGNQNSMESSFAARSTQ